MLIIKDLKKNFNKGTENEVNIFKNFNLVVREGEFVAILGTNGCGKSTLFNLISGSLKDDGGQIFVKTSEVTQLNEEKRAKKIAKVHQDPSKGVAPSLTILENLSLAMKKNERFSLRNLIKNDKKKDFINILKELDLGLENKLDIQVKFLSGGQRQALSLIMATLKKPDLLLLDEHTAALDPKTSNMIMKKTKELVKKEKITTLMISHNLKDVLTYSDRVIMLSKGEIILDEKSCNITEKELSEIYNFSIEKNSELAS